MPGCRTSRAASLGVAVAAAPTPVAKPDSYTAWVQGSGPPGAADTLHVGPPGVLGNDVTPAGGSTPLTAVLVVGGGGRGGWGRRAGSVSGRRAVLSFHLACDILLRHYA